MQEDNSHPIAQHVGREKLAKYRVWALRPFKTLQRQPKYSKMAVEWRLE